MLAAALAGAAGPALAQTSARPYRVGVLNEALAANHPAVEGLKAGLRELGLAEGRDVAFEIRFTQGDRAAIRDGALAYARAGVDLIFTSNEEPTRQAMAATTKIPIVFTLVGDPVAAGIVGNPAAPQGKRYRRFESHLRTSGEAPRAAAHARARDAASVGDP